MIHILINKLTHHIPILLITIPMISIFLCAFLRKPFYLSKVSIISSLINLFLCIPLYSEVSKHNHVLYSLGNWAPPIGIEFRIDYFNLPIIICINTIFSLFFTFSSKLLESQVLSITPANKIWIIYSLLLLSQLGFLGMSITADLFNLYVFIEITSLSAYALMSLGRDKRAVIGAFHYLIFGTIGATFILLAVGLLMLVTGSLNMTDIKLRAVGLYSNKAFIIAIAFYLTGTILKVALMPMHSWMIKAYEYVPAIIIALLTGISNFVGFYIILRFIYGVLDYHILYNELYIGRIFELLGVTSIIMGSVIASFAGSLKKIMIFSSLTHIGYISLSLAITGREALETTVIYLISDIFLKTALFIATSILEDLKSSTKLSKLQNIAKLYPLFSLALCLNLINNAGIPPTIYFFNKITLIKVFLKNEHFLTFIAIIIASLFGLFYNYRIIDIIYFNENKKLLNMKTQPTQMRQISKRSKFLFYIFSIINIILVFFYPILSDYTKLITKVIF